MLALGTKLIWDNVTTTFSPNGPTAAVVTGYTLSSRTRVVIGEPPLWVTLWFPTGLRIAKWRSVYMTIASGEARIHTASEFLDAPDFWGADDWVDLDAE